MTRDKSAENLAWTDYQEQLAAEFGLSVVLVEGEDSSVLASANNNSICKNLFYSKEFSPACAKFCGSAVRDAHKAGGIIHSKCHAGLSYSVTPLKIGGRKFAVITGRAFSTTKDYRDATERAMNGDWRQFTPEQLFSNILLSSSRKDVAQLAARVEILDDDEKHLLDTFLESQKLSTPEEISEEIPAQTSAESAVNTNSEMSPPAKGLSLSSLNMSPEQIVEWRSLFGTLLDLGYQEACNRLLEFVGERFQLKDLAWLERVGDEFKVVASSGVLATLDFKMAMPADDPRLLESFHRGTSIEFRERPTADPSKRRSIQVFSVTVGEKVRGALVVGNGSIDRPTKKRLSVFVRNVASDLEILRLRKQIDRQSLLADAVRRFNENLRSAEAEDIFPLISHFCVELMRAERGSLLLYDDETNRLVIKATIGIQPEEFDHDAENIGDRVARRVWETSKAAVAHDLASVGLKPAVPSRRYKSETFISYPIIVGKKRMGVLNVTDRIDGTGYDNFDLELLDTFAPQLAIALDRLTLKQRAGKFEQLSITDTLTGLLNRRYLQARLSEEIKRSARQGYPMSFMMIDVDFFKEYNDQFTHPEGDKALQLVAEALKSTLRGADVAARYGGEEFSILLPQTSLAEALTIAERIRKKVEETRFPHRGVTVSIGLATFTSELSSPEALISAADQALFDAKKAGRNIVRTYVPKRRMVQRLNS